MCVEVCACVVCLLCSFKFDFCSLNVLLQKLAVATAAELEIEQSSKCTVVTCLIINAKATPTMVKFDGGDSAETRKKNGCSIADYLCGPANARSLGHCR